MQCIAFVLDTIQTRPADYTLSLSLSSDSREVREQPHLGLYHAGRLQSSLIAETKLLGVENICKSRWASNNEDPVATETATFVTEATALHLHDSRKPQGLQTAPRLASAMWSYWKCVGYLLLCQSFTFMSSEQPHGGNIDFCTVVTRYCACKRGSKNTLYVEEECEFM